MRRWYRDSRCLALSLRPHHVLSLLIGLRGGHPIAPSRRARRYTLWFGGMDPVTGLAIPGGIWDFDDAR